YAAELWSSIFAAGQEFGIKPVGLGARDTLRLEMGYCLYANDIDDTTSPLEAGLGWVTKFNKQFISSELLSARIEYGLTVTLVGITVLEGGVPRPPYDITDASQEVIATITSGTHSPTLGKGIARCYLPLEYSNPGTEVVVNVRERFLKAE